MTDIWKFGLNWIPTIWKIDETINSLRVKHPSGRGAHEDVPLQSQIPTVENVLFDVVKEKMVFEAANITRSAQDFRVVKPQSPYNAKDVLERKYGYCYFSECSQRLS